KEPMYSARLASSIVSLCLHWLYMPMKTQTHTHTHTHNHTQHTTTHTHTHTHTPTHTPHPQHTHPCPHTIIHTVLIQLLPAYLLCLLCQLFLDLRFLHSFLCHAFLRRWQNFLTRSPAPRST